MLGPQDIWVALALGIFFFGAKKLPELSRSLGQAMSEFKRGVAGSADEAPAPTTAPPAPAPAPGPLAPPATAAVETVPAPVLSTTAATEPAAADARGAERGSG